MWQIPHSLVSASGWFDMELPLYDIFNYLICHSTTYDKQGLAAYKSFEDYSLFEDGYVESLLMKTLINERLHVYVGKVRPAMKDGRTTIKNATIFGLFVKEKAQTEAACWKQSA